MQRYEGNMTQSASSPYPIRPIEEDELDGFIGVDEHAFNTTPWTEGDRRVALDQFEFDRTLAAFDATTPVGVTMCYSFQLSVPGLQMLPAAGVTFVAVMPTYRRQGVLSSLMRRQLADVRERGEPLATLWASESSLRWLRKSTIGAENRPICPTAPRPSGGSLRWPFE